MDLGEINPVLLVASLMVAATPLLLAAIGELVVEKAGVLNLGVEGMMIVGAISGFAISVETGSPWLGFVAAAIGGAVLSLLFRVADPGGFGQPGGQRSGPYVVRAWVQRLAGAKLCWDQTARAWGIFISR